jgi:hypothetical protein
VLPFRSGFKPSAGERSCPWIDCHTLIARRKFPHHLTPFVAFAAFAALGVQLLSQALPSYQLLAQGARLVYSGAPPELLNRSFYSTCSSTSTASSRGASSQQPQPTWTSYSKSPTLTCSILSTPQFYPLHRLRSLRMRRFPACARYRLHTLPKPRYGTTSPPLPTCRSNQESTRI